MSTPFTLHCALDVHDAGAFAFFTGKMPSPTPIPADFASLTKPSSALFTCAHFVGPPPSAYVPSIIEPDESSMT